MTTSEMRTKILAIPAGKRAQWESEGRWRLIVRHTDGAYVLDCAWPVPDAYDEDPESLLCGSSCPFSGRSHAHATREYPAADLDQLATDAQQALADRVAGHAVTFASRERVG